MSSYLGFGNTWQRSWRLLQRMATISDQSLIRIQPLQPAVSQSLYHIQLSTQPIFSFLRALPTFFDGRVLLFALINPYSEVVLFGDEFLELLIQKKQT